MNVGQRAPRTGARSPGPSDGNVWRAYWLGDLGAWEARLALDAVETSVATKAVTAVYQSHAWSTQVTGTNDDYFVAGAWELTAGRTFSDTEERAGKAVCVIGETVRQKLFGGQNPVGSEVRLKGFACEVIGLLKGKGQAAMGQDQDDAVVMPLRTVQRRLTGTQDIGRIIVSAARGSSLDAVKLQLTSLLRERRKIGDNEEDDFRVMDTRQLAETLTGTTRILTMLLAPWRR